MPTHEKFFRQLDVADPKLFNLPVTVVGCGGVGSPSAVALAKMGIKDLNLIDFDVFEPHNVPNQFCFEQMHLGKNKAQAVASLCVLMGGEKDSVHAYPIKLDANNALRLLRGIVISAVDSMEVRKVIFEMAKLQSLLSPWIIDVRTAAQFIKVLTVNMNNSESCKVYVETLHTDGEATPEICTARNIIYTSMGAGAIVSKLVRDIQIVGKVPREICFDFETFLVTVVNSEGVFSSNADSIVT